MTQGSRAVDESRRFDQIDEGGTGHAGSEKVRRGQQRCVSGSTVHDQPPLSPSSPVKHCSSVHRIVATNSLAELFKQTEEESAPKDRKVLYIAMSSDGGLCGGIHSSISRALRRDLAKTPGEIAIVGDKPKAQLSRTLSKNFVMSFSSVGKDVPTFAEASAIADEIVKDGGAWDEVSRLCRTARP